ncbi:MAG TPA: VIT domain-containing protein [Dongiaceae bacterium]|nr:VIT domain-containing protein [Dongiaceae bacterium]
MGLLTLFAWLGVSLPGQAIGLIVVPNSDWTPPVVPGPPVHAFAPLEMVSAQVTAQITDQVATTKVAQEFANPGGARLEGTFLFPLPEGAHIDKFTMEIDGHAVSAELLPADKARGIYEDIVRKMRDPALLEYAGRDTVKVRIFPIEPHSHKHIELAYTQLLKADAGLVDYHLPLDAGKYSATPIQNLSVKVELATARPLKTIYSPTHAVEIKRDGTRQAVVGYEATQVRPDADFQLCYATSTDELGVNLLTQRNAGEDGFFVLLASPGMDVKEQRVLPKDVVFVLDTSGSMAGAKMEQAKKALRFCVDNLNREDRFELVRFSTEVEPLFEKLVPASAENCDRAEQFIKDLRPIGGTDIADALKTALDLRPHEETRPFVVIFLTDGQPTIGTTDEDTIVAGVKAAAGGTRVFCFGVGTDVNTHLLDRITQDTRAFSQYVLPEEDLEVKVSNFFTKIKEPVLANPTLKFTGGIKATKLYPAPLPDLFKGEQLVVAGRYSGSGPAAIIVEGKVNGQVKQYTYEVKFPATDSGHEFVPRLWATRRVGYLLDEIRLHGESAELRDEITTLARQYSIVTPYTAYLIVEDETKRNVPVALQSLPTMGQDMAVRETAAHGWGYFKSENDGLAGVANARMGYALASADQASVGAVNGATENSRAMGLPALTPAAPPVAGTMVLADKPTSESRLVQYTQQSQYVAGKNFFQNGNQWVDPAVQQQQNQKAIRLQFNSREYFAFAASNAVARPWLALGQNVQFVLNGQVYEIYE